MWLWLLMPRDWVMSTKGGSSAGVEAWMFGERIGDSAMGAGPSSQGLGGMERSIISSDEKTVTAMCIMAKLPNLSSFESHLSRKL
mmetsp:Transcript_36848/g.76940  ORF Transcript_36848/g.76940 Transcript_36848/m.76940 type:complete len:85 (+) Transcript_36848:109-363(+)